MFLGSGVILFTLFVVAEAQKILQQEISAPKGNTVEFSCKVSGMSSSDYIHWYHKKEGGTLNRVLRIDSSGSFTSDTTDKNIRKSGSNKNGLKISSIEEKHAGIYYCAYYDGLIKRFGSGTRLIVSDKPKKAPDVIIYPPSKTQDGKTALVCIAKGMFPGFVRFKWKDTDGDILEHKIEDGSASILIINESKAGVKQTCMVEHDGKANSMEWNPTGSTEREVPRGVLPACNDTGLYQTESFLPSRRLYLASLIYTLMTLKSVAYFGAVSLLMYKRST